MSERSNVSDLDLKVIHDASHAIGSAVMVINFVEQALDIALTHYFEADAASLALLPMLDFRSKMLVIKRDQLLSQIIGGDLRSRLHRLYDNRNTLAHGYVKLATDGEVLEFGELFEVRHPRHEASLRGSEVKALHREAVALVDMVASAVEEIADFLTPLRTLRREDPDGTPAEFIARLRRQIDELTET